ncbi:MAG: EamA family transporter [Pseudomonadota bacterium]
MNTYLPFILFTVLTNAAAQIMLKYGMTQIGDFSSLHSNLIIKLLQVVFTPFVFLGLCTFVISMASHLYVLSKVELSYAYPFLSLAYVVVAAYAYFIFHEDLNAMRVLGIALICVGTVFIAQGGTKQDAVAANDRVQTASLKETSK